MSGVIWRMTSVLSVGSVEPSTAAATDAGERGVEPVAPVGAAELVASGARVVGALILVEEVMGRRMTGKLLGQTLVETGGR